MNPNMYPIGPRFGQQPVFIPGFHTPPHGGCTITQSHIQPYLYQSPPAGSVPMSVQGPGLPYQPSQNVHQYQTPTTAISGYQQTPTVQPSHYKTFSPVSQPVRSPVMVVNSLSLSAPEYVPTSPLSPLLQSFNQSRRTPPPNGTSDTGKIEDSTKLETAEEIFKAKASHYGINITTKSDKINDIAARAYRKVEAEKGKILMESAQRQVDELKTQSFMEKASRYGIKIENPNNNIHFESRISDSFTVGRKGSQTDHEDKRINSRHNELELDFNENNTERENTEFHKREEIESEFNKKEDNVSSDTSDSEKIGIEQSHIIHALQTKKLSKYEQMLTVLRQKSYAHEAEDYDDLSTPELQSPRDAILPADWGNFKETCNNTTRNCTNLPDGMSDNFVGDKTNINGSFLHDESDPEIVKIAHTIVQKAMTAAIQELRVEGIMKRAKEKKHKRTMGNSLYTWITKHSGEISEHEKSLANTSSGETDDRRGTPESDDSNINPNVSQNELLTDKNIYNYTDAIKQDNNLEINFETVQKGAWSCNDDTDRCVTPHSDSSDTKTNDYSELNPQSQEFKPSGFKFLKNTQSNASSATLKADVPEFIPSVTPMYVPKNKSQNYTDYSNLRHGVNTQKSQICQTEVTEVSDISTNTKRTKLCDKITETKSCDVRDIILNTVESMFDQQSDYFINDNSEEVDHGHLDAYVQTDENENSLNQKVIDAQRQLLRTRCFACKQQLEQEMQHIRSSKYQMYTVFSHLEDRTALSEIVENRILFIKAEIHRIQTKLGRYELMLDNGVSFDEVPGFGLTMDLDSVQGTLVRSECKEIQTDSQNLQPNGISQKEECDIHHRRFMAEAVRKILRKLDGHFSIPNEMLEIVKDMKLVCHAMADHLIHNSHVESSKSVSFSQGEVTAETKAIESAAQVEGDNSVSLNVLTERLETNNIPIENSDFTQETKENSDLKEKVKSKKAKKSKKKTKNEQGKIELSAVHGNNQENINLLSSDSVLGFKENITTDITDNSSDMSIPIERNCTAKSSIEVEKSEIKSEMPRDVLSDHDKIAYTNEKENLQSDFLREKEVTHSLEDIDDDEADFDIETVKSLSSDYFSTLSSGQASQSITPGLNLTVEDSLICSMKTDSMNDLPQMERTPENVVKNDFELLSSKQLKVPVQISESLQESNVVLGSSHNVSADSATCKSVDITESQNPSAVGIVSANVAEGQNVSGSQVQDETPQQVPNTNVGQSAVTNSSLYEAVVQQLKQAYPLMASNPVMLNMIAAQQTSVLQMYIGQSGGSGVANQVPSIGMTGVGLANPMQAYTVGNEISNQTEVLKMDGDYDNQTQTSGLSSGDIQNEIQEIENAIQEITNSDAGETNVNTKESRNDSSQDQPTQPIKSSIETFYKQVEMVNEVQNKTKEAELETPTDPYKELKEKFWDKNNCNSLMEKVDKYLSSSEMETKSDAAKPLSSSIIDQSTLAAKISARPPGFVGKNDFSVECASTNTPSPSESSTVVPSKSSSLNELSEEHKSPKLSELADKKPASGKDMPPRKPLNIPGSSFTFSKTLTHNLPQSKPSDFNATSLSDAKKDTNKKIPLLPDPHQIKKPPLLRRPDKIPSLLSLPISSDPRIRSRQRSQNGNLSGFDSNTPSPTDSEKQWQFPVDNIHYNGPSNLPPRLQKKRRSSENAVSRHGQLSSEPSWDEEVDDYAEPFILHHDVKKPIESHVRKQADKLDDIPLSVKRKTDEVKREDKVAEENKDKGGEENKDKKEEEDEEDWCQVTKKKKKESKSDVKKPRTRHQSASDKSTRSNNFDRLVGMMLEIFTGLTRSQVIDVISEIRTQRNGLTGLTAREIMEIARTVVIRKYEYKMINNQRPLQASDVINKSSLVTFSRKKEQQEIATGHPSQPVPVSNRFDVVETPEERVKQMKAYHAMKAQEALSNQGKGCVEDEDICVICHDELTSGETKTLDCKHEFHTECISKWVYERERTCPTCRGHALFVEDFPKLGS